MCMQTTCQACMLATWSGCGRHIDSALMGIPMDKRCKCKPCTQADMDKK